MVQKRYVMQSMLYTGNRIFGQHQPGLWNTYREQARQAMGCAPHFWNLNPSTAWEPGPPAAFIASFGERTALSMRLHGNKGAFARLPLI